MPAQAQLLTVPLTPLLPLMPPLARLLLLTMAVVCRAPNGSALHALSRHANNCSSPCVCMPGPPGQPNASGNSMGCHCHALACNVEDGVCRIGPSRQELHDLMCQLPPVFFLLVDVREEKRRAAVVLTERAHDEADHSVDADAVALLGIQWL